MFLKNFELFEKSQNSIRNFQKVNVSNIDFLKIPYRILGFFKKSKIRQKINF